MSFNSWRGRRGRFHRSWLLGLTALFLLAAQAVLATHFRYGNNSWRPGPGPNEIEFQVSEAWRWSAFGNPPLGSVTNSSSVLSFGDGDGTGFNLLVTSVDPSNDWFFGVALDPNRPPGDTSDTLISHTYPSTGDFLISTDGCCRISQQSDNFHVNNPDGSYRVESTVNVGTGNSSPVSTLPPIVQCPESGLCQFTVPASDPDGDTLRFRFSTADEAGGFFVQPGPPDAPNAASVNANSGVYTWDTTGATLGPPGSNTLYSSQVTIEDLSPLGDVKSKIAVDFLIQLTRQVGNRPVFDHPPTPPCGSTLTTDVNQNLAFTMQASDVDSGDTVTLNVAGLPPGATMNPPLPTSGNPVSSDFSWTPNPGQEGTYVVTFTATDSTSQQALCSLTIEVKDTARPRCSLVSRDGSSMTVRVQDAGSGLVSIDVTALENIASITPGDQTYSPPNKDPVDETAVKADPSQRARWSILASDAAGNTTRCTSTGFLQF